MKTVTLDMTIGAERARGEWEALPDSTPRERRDAYWRRYQKLQQAEENAWDVSGLTAITYLEKAEGGKKTPPAPKPKPAKTTTMKNTETTIVSPIKIDPKIIAPRCLAALEKAGDWTFGAFNKHAKIAESEWHQAIRARRLMSQGFLDRFCHGLNCNPVWLLTGAGDMFEEGGATKGPGRKVPGAGAAVPGSERGRPRKVGVRASGLKAKGRPRKVKDQPGGLPATATLSDERNAGDILEDLRGALLELQAAKAKVEKLASQIHALAA